MNIKRLALVGVPILALAAVLPLSATAGGAQHVQWDIISLAGGAPPGPISAGGHASAMAPGGDMITLTGEGTFVAPGSSGGSSAVTGGGTWETSSGSGTFDVTGLVSWAPANHQSATPAFTDNIGDLSARTNGTAVLRVRFSDGQSGVLTVGCHGPGAPPGIIEGIATTKGFKTYYETEEPEPGVDANRTLFHILK